MCKSPTRASTVTEKRQISPLPGKSTAGGAEILKYLPKEAALFQFSSESQLHVLLMVGQNKAATNHGCFMDVSSAFASAPLCPARDAPAATCQVQSCHQPGSTEETGSAHGGTEIRELCQEKERGGRRRAELHCRTCFSSQITWRCSQISAYIGFSLFLFLFPKQSPLLYDKKKKKNYMNAFTC